MIRVLVLSSLFFSMPMALAEDSHGPVSADSVRRQRPEEVNLTRPADPYFRGELVYGPQKLRDGSIGNCPFLKLPDGRTFGLRTYSEKCGETIKACEGGEQCRVKGVLSRNDIWVEEIEALKETPMLKNQDPNYAQNLLARIIRYASVDARDSAKQEENIKKFGKVWLAPNGTIWGAVAKDENGNPLPMLRADAVKYCASIGGELPTREDYVALRGYLESEEFKNAPGAASEFSYPGGHRLDYSNYLWTSSVRIGANPDEDEAYYFNTKTNRIQSTRHFRRVNGWSVRCVVRS